MNKHAAHVMLTLDVVILRLTEKGKEVLLIRRLHAPYLGMWALPGGKLNEDDLCLEDAARRELFEETGIQVTTLEQVATFGDLGRDPRGRFISVVYESALLPGEMSRQAGDDAAAVQWFPLTNLPPLAFDHAHILGRILEKIHREALPFHRTVERTNEE